MVLRPCLYTTEGFSLEGKDICNGSTGGGVACYIRNSFMYKRLSNLEETELGVTWLKIMPKKCLENSPV